mgnify:CR=1 FL=1
MGKRPFKKILIANRGEIAVRVLDACRKLGIRTVAVYSDADRGAMHARMADEAHYIGESPAAMSYLLGDRIIEVARETGAEAIHPGYGFLSENASFASAVERSGVVFIGPRADAMKKLGDKIRARALAVKLGVPVLPGAKRALKNPEDALAVARRIGFPVLIKASAGGGGRGMRLAHGEEDFAGAIEEAMSESQASFGSSEVFFERFVGNAKHIEIQILADGRGGCVHFGERECSVQRRHQKVIEETPAAVMTDEMRGAMTDSAIRLAREAGYTNAGTVEFILDEDRSFYFLEMNTRLQVEHPITELRFGVDLVALQIEIAAGAPLPFEQREIAASGAAIECRICAEDAANGHLPSLGTVHALKWPDIEGLRVDTALYEGCEITPHYDSLVAKISVHASDRVEAIRHMRCALNNTEIRGIGTNIPLCEQVLTRPEFLSGEYYTNLLRRAPFAVDTKRPGGLSPDEWIDMYI